MYNQFGPWGTYQPAVSDKDSQTVSEISTVVMPLLWQAIFAEDKDEFDSLIAQARKDADALGYQEVVANDQARYVEFINALKADGVEWAMEVELP